LKEDYLGLAFGEFRADRPIAYQILKHFIW